MKGHSPRKRTRTKLLARTVLTRTSRYSVKVLSRYPLARLRAVVRLEQIPPTLTESSSESGNEFAPNRQTERQEADALDARIPGVTSEELLRFKRQMYRKDI